MLLFRLIPLCEQENLLSPPPNDLLLLPVPYPELLLDRGGEKLRSYLKLRTKTYLWILINNEHYRLETQIVQENWKFSNYSSGSRIPLEGGRGLLKFLKLKNFFSPQVPKNFPKWINWGNSKIFKINDFFSFTRSKIQWKIQNFHFFITSSRIHHCTFQPIKLRILQEFSKMNIAKKADREPLLGVNLHQIHTCNCSEGHWLTLRLVHNGMTKAWHVCTCIRKKSSHLQVKVAKSCGFVVFCHKNKI